MKDQLIATFNDYFKTICDKDNEGTIGYIYPALFDNFPKDVMLSALNRAKADPTTTVDVSNAEIISVSDILEIGESKYALIKYTFTMLVISHTSNKKNQSDPLTPDRLIYEGLAERYGMKNVKFNSERRGFEVTTGNEMYAIKDHNADWKFLDKKERLSVLLAKILPAEVIEAFK